MAVTITKIKIGEYFSYDGSWDSRGNGVGGFDLGIEFKNNSSKVIKYITFVVTAYNSVGDPAVCEVQETATRNAKLTGPVNAGATSAGIWDTMWYNHALASVKIDKILIDYMDGTSEEQTTGLQVVAPQSTNDTSGGCYVATAVYGSYDCPEVWTLRRYRDNQLAKTWYGRLFIHTYYAISPTLVKCFGDTQWFKNMWKPKLDSIVKELQEQGVENTPYDDIEW